jgi:NAD(P)-dependent dehydrogenase (short-subunit alcohol dehydrogenase family)
VAIASAAGERGLFKLTGYTASKHAVIGIVRGLAADLVGTGVTAVAIAPGSTDTAMLAATADLYNATPEELAHRQGIRRLLTPEEIAATIALCCSPAGAALNGSVVRADGGFGG